MTEKGIFRIQFINQGKLYELYARSVGPSSIPGFIEIGELTFGEKSALLVDPSEEGLKNEFSEVRRSYIPVHCVVRIDEVESQGSARVRESDGEQKVHLFPTLATPPKADPKE